MSVVGDDAHRRWRYQLGIAEGDQEIPSGGGGGTGRHGRSAAVCTCAVAESCAGEHLATASLSTGPHGDSQTLEMQQRDLYWPWNVLSRS